MTQDCTVPRHSSKNHYFLSCRMINTYSTKGSEVGDSKELCPDTIFKLYNNTNNFVKAMFYLLINGQRQCNLFSSIFLKVCAHKNHEKLERLLNHWNFKYILHNLVCTKIQVKYKHKAIMIILCKSVLCDLQLYIKVSQFCYLWKDQYQIELLPIGKGP